MSVRIIQAVGYGIEQYPCKYQCQRDPDSKLQVSHEKHKQRDRKEKDDRSIKPGVWDLYGLDFL